MSEKVSVIDLILRRYERKVSETFYPHLYVDKASTLEEALRRFDQRPNMSGV